jgi:ATP-binding cassette subfamily B multidrug efflux pump
VDSYTNIMTVKLFARAEQEDAHVREALERLNHDFGRQTRLVTLNALLLSTLNAMLLVGTAGLAIWLWSRGEVPLAVVASALPMAWQIANISGWVAFNVAGIFENIGVVQEAMGSIAVPPTAPDPGGALPLRVTRGAIRFEKVAFSYGRSDGSVLQGLDLDIRPGERVGLVGHSRRGQDDGGEPAAPHLPPGGRTDPGGRPGHRRRDAGEPARRRSDGDAGHALLHRSIRDNIRYGRPLATDAEVEAAARRAVAHEFIGA